MAARLVFLGKLADLAGVAECEVPASGWEPLLSSLGVALAEELRSDRVRAALNGTVLADKQAIALADGDELALLPPVSGG